jgi:TRAP-type uncharacterized transport system substrate-binding protein
VPTFAVTATLVTRADVAADLVKALVATRGLSAPLLDGAAAAYEALPAAP